MSIRWITKVWSDSPYDGTRLLIHLALADIAHDDGRFFASQKNLADKGRCSIEYVRKVINQMIEEGHLKIITKGSSRGKATVYQLLLKKPPNKVGESLPIMDDDLPNSDGDISPTLEVQLPNATPYHPSYTSVLSTTEETAIAVIPSGKEAAKIWWELQEIKPLGKGAWHSLLQITEAAEKRGFTVDQIVKALNYIGTVPTMRQMDLILRGVGVKSKADNQRNAALELARRFGNELE